MDKLLVLGKCWGLGRLPDMGSVKVKDEGLRVDCRAWEVTGKW